MRITEISFCDKIGYNIRSDESKKYFLQKIESTYGIKIIAKHFEGYNVNTIQTLNQNPFIVCLRSNGNPYLMFITKYNDNDIVILIDKKIQQGYFLPRMIIVHVMIGNVNSGLHDDTIFDGEMVKKNDGSWTYLIHDMYVYKGKYMSDINIIKRLNIIYRTLNDEYLEDERCPFTISVKKYFTYDELKTHLYKHIENINYTCRGIYFKPLFLKFKDILINFDDSLIKKVSRNKMGGNFLLQSDNINNNHVIESDNESYSSNNSLSIDHVHKECSDNDILQNTQDMCLFTRKTSYPDVYEILDNSGSLMGNVCIPTMKQSIYMRDLFKEKSLIDRIKIMYCWNEKFNKWMPKI